MAGFSRRVGGKKGVPVEKMRFFSTGTLKNSKEKAFHLSEQVGKVFSEQIRPRATKLQGDLRRGKVAADGGPAAGGEVGGGNEEVEHAAVEEAEAPVVVFVNLQKVDHAGHFLDHFVVKWPAQQLEPVPGRTARVPDRVTRVTN